MFKNICYFYDSYKYTTILSNKFIEKLLLDILYNFNMYNDFFIPSTFYDIYYNV